jgi:transposase
MARAGPKKIARYSLAFKRAAVELSRQRGVYVQAVAAALDIHPFMLSKWRKEYREGRMRNAPTTTRAAVPRREVQRLQALERAHAQLQEEHALLKKAIRFSSAAKRTSSRSSTGSAARSRLRGSAGSTR